MPVIPEPKIIVPELKILPIVVAEPKVLPVVAEPKIIVPKPKLLPVAAKPVQICCYCKCTYNDIKNQQDAYRKTKKVVSKDKSESVTQQISVTEQTGNRCSKTGIISCSLRNKCLAGTFFHIKCVEAADPNFDFERKARAKWFCMLCQPPNSETCSELKPPSKIPDLVAAVPLVEEKTP